MFDLGDKPLGQIGPLGQFLLGQVAQLSQIPNAFSNLHKSCKNGIKRNLFSNLLDIIRRNKFNKLNLQNYNALFGFVKHFFHFLLKFWKSDG